MTTVARNILDAANEVVDATGDLYDLFTKGGSGGTDRAKATSRVEAARNRLREAVQAAPMPQGPKGVRMAVLRRTRDTLRDLVAETVVKAYDRGLSDEIKATCSEVIEQATVILTQWEGESLFTAIDEEADRMHPGGDAEVFAAAYAEATGEPDRVEALRDAIEAFDRIPPGPAREETGRQVRDAALEVVILLQNARPALGSLMDAAEADHAAARHAMLDDGGPIPMRALLPGELVDRANAVVLALTDQTGPGFTRQKEAKDVIREILDAPVAAMSKSERESDVKLDALLDVVEAILSQMDVGDIDETMLRDEAARARVYVAEREGR